MSFEYQKTVDEFNEHLHKLLVIKSQILSAKDALVYVCETETSDSSNGSILILEEKVKALGDLHGELHGAFNQLIEVLKSQNAEIKELKQRFEKPED